MSAVLTEPDLLTISVPGGVAGFPGSQTFALVELSPSSPFFRLCSLDVPGLDFLVVPPAVFFPDYAPEIDDAWPSSCPTWLTDDSDVMEASGIATMRNPRIRMRAVPPR